MEQLPPQGTAFEHKPEAVRDSGLIDENAQSDRRMIV
jgi:hypothetical protein